MFQVTRETTASALSRAEFLRLIMGAAAGAALPAAALAQDYPARPVTLVNPFAAGGTADLIARLVGDEMTKRLKQSFIIESKAGAGGTIGATAVAAADPDGYMLLTSNIASNATAKSLFKKLRYDPLEGFTHLGGIGRFPNVLLVPKASPYNSVSELIAGAKGKPDSLTYGSAGAGSTPHLAAVLLEMQAKVKLIHVPFRGAAPAMTSLIGNEISMQFENLPTALAFIGSGDVRPLAVTSATRIEALPEVATMVEQGLPEFLAESWYGLSAPPALPQPIAARLSETLQASLKGENLVARFKQLGITTADQDGAQYRDYIRQEIDKWAAVIKAAGVEPN